MAGTRLTRWVSFCLLMGLLGCERREPVKPTAEKPSPERNASVATNAARPVVALPTNTAPVTPASTALQRELSVGYLLAGLPALDRLPGEDLDGDGKADVGRLAFDTELRQRLLAHVRGLQIGFSPAVALAASDVLFVGADGRANATARQQFTMTVLPANQLAAEDFTRYAQHEMAIEHLSQVMASGSGFLPQRVARRLFEFGHEQFQMEVVFFAATNHLNEVVVNDAVTAEFYTNNTQRYLPPPRLRVAYVRLPLVAFDQVARLPVADIEENVRSIYRSNGAAGFPDATGKPMTEADALRQIRCTVLTHRRMEKLRQQIFAGALPDVARLREAMKTETTPPALRVEETEGSVGFGAPDALANTFDIASRLQENRLSPQLVFETDAICLVGLIQRQQPALPPFGSLPLNSRLIVARDYRAEKALAASQIRGKALRQIFSARLQQGEPFDRICRDANVTRWTLPAFTLSQSAWPTYLQPLPLAEVQQAVRELLDANATASRLTPVATTPGGGYVLHLAARVPPSEANTTAMFPAYLNGMRQQGIAAASVAVMQPMASTRGSQMRPAGWFLPEWEQMRLKMLVEVKRTRQMELPRELAAERQLLAQSTLALADKNGTGAAQAKLRAQHGQHQQRVQAMEEERVIYQAAQQRLAATPSLAAATEGVATALPANETAANDALRQFMVGTNRVTGAVLSQFATAHTGTAAALRTRLMAAALFCAAGQPQAAQQELQPLLDNPPKPLAAAVRLGAAACLDDMGKMDEALAAYRRVIEQHPHQLEAIHARLAVGALHEARKEYPLAAARYVEVMNTDPVGYWARIASALHSRLPNGGR